MSVFEVILVRTFPTFSRIWTEYGEISLRILSESGKMRGKYGPEQLKNVGIQFKHNNVLLNEDEKY